MRTVEEYYRQIDNQVKSAQHASDNAIAFLGEIALEIAAHLNEAQKRIAELERQLESKDKK